MANNTAFQPMGKTAVLSTNVSSGNVTANINADSPVNQFMFVNTGTNDVFVNISGNSSITATRPTVGSNQYGFCIGANSQRVIGNSQSSANVTIYVAGVSNAGNSLIYITPGEGL